MVLWKVNVGLLWFKSWPKLQTGDVWAKGVGMTQHVLQRKTIISGDVKTVRGEFVLEWHCLWHRLRESLCQRSSTVHLLIGQSDLVQPVTAGMKRLSCQADKISQPVKYPLGSQIIKVTIVRFWNPFMSNNHWDSDSDTGIRSGSRSSSTLFTWKNEERKVFD